MRSPWNGGSISLRRRRCSSSSCSSNDELPEQRLEDDVAPGGDRVHAVGREQPLDRLRVGEEDDVAGAEQAGAEGLAQLAAPVLEEGQRAEDETRRLHRLRQRDRRNRGRRPRGGRPRGLGAMAASDHPTALLASPADDLRARRSRARRLREGARDVRGDGDEIVMVASDRISAYDVVLPTRDPRQGQGADPDVGVLVRDDRPHRPQPPPLPGRARGGRRQGAAGEAARDVPGRVRRPRLHHRLGLARVPADRLGLRDRAARRACASPTSSPSRSSPRRPRPRSATTTRTSTSTAPPRSSATGR